MNIKIATTNADFEKCWPAVQALRPHLSREVYLSQVQQQVAEGYILAYVDGKVAPAICGYRYLNFLFCGPHFYIDDLSTLPEARGQGHATALLDFVISEAKKHGFKHVTLDSGHHRHTAHRLYLNKGFTIKSHHFVLDID